MFGVEYKALAASKIVASEKDYLTAEPIDVPKIEASVLKEKTVILRFFC